MKALSLFSGIGGIDLACEWVGIETVAFCEREPFCQRVLRKHWPNVPIYDDVCTLTKERLDADGIGPIELIHGGYPCQPFSSSGLRRGKADDRHLWPEVKRLLEEVRPRWFIGENVAGHITLGLDEVLADLDDIGYAAQSFSIPSIAVNADHERERVFIIANTERSGRTGVLCPELATNEEPYPHWATNALDARSHPIPRMEQSLGEPSLFRSDDGLPDRMDRSLISPRLKALGNAVNPYQVYPILVAIKQIDDLLKDTGEGQ
ncbi:DNA cytosine methyltransferase [Paenibacillus ehimensis]|uniref:DNA cytosine methyltransferase n=1 Tax=Paenibacillus ehimensis TaxID=79264 RepID=UPI0004710F84|nr:DNA cytosine methyltransferase [Paenibacillus ehimensis]